MTTESSAIPSISDLAGTKFKAVIDGGEQVQKFKALIDGAFGLLSEFFLMANESGIWLRQLDSSKASMVYFEVDASFFQEYLFESDHEEVMFCLPADVINRIMKKATKKCDKIELELIPRSKEARFGVAVFGDVTLREKVVLLTPPEDAAKKPNISKAGMCQMVAVELQTYVKEVAKAGIRFPKFSLRDKTEYAETEHGEAVVYPRGMVIEGENDDTEIFYEMPDEDSVWNIFVEGSKTQEVIVSGELLKQGVKMFHKSDELKVWVTTRKPFMVETNEEGRRAGFIIAPRVERR